MQKNSSLLDPRNKNNQPSLLNLITETTQNEAMNNTNISERNACRGVKQQSKLIDYNIFLLDDSNSTLKLVDFSEIDAMMNNISTSFKTMQITNPLNPPVIKEDFIKMTKDKISFNQFIKLKASRGVNINPIPTTNLIQKENAKLEKEDNNKSQIPIRKPLFELKKTKPSNKGQSVAFKIRKKEETKEDFDMRIIIPLNFDENQQKETLPLFNQVIINQENEIDKNLTISDSNTVNQDRNDDIEIDNDLERDVTINTTPQSILSTKDTDGSANKTNMRCLKKIKKMLLKLKYDYQTNTTVDKKEYTFVFNNTTYSITFLRKDKHFESFQLTSSQNNIKNEYIKDTDITKEIKSLKQKMTNTFLNKKREHDQPI